MQTTDTYRLLQQKKILKNTAYIPFIKEIG